MALSAAPLCLAHTKRGVVRTAGLELGHRLEQMGQVVRRDRPDHGATVRTHLDQTGHGELAKRLANRRSGGSESIRQALLVQARARQEATPHDGIRDLDLRRIGPCAWSLARATRCAHFTSSSCGPAV
jgi:hypothetical protein